MRRGWLCAVVLALILGGCGGDGETSQPSGATGVQGASGVAGEAQDVTAEEFLSKLLPEKQLAVEGVVASQPACAGVKVEPALILVISDAASKADPDAPLTELVEAEC